MCSLNLSKCVVQLKVQNRHYSMNPSKALVGYIKIECKENACFLLIIIDNLRLFKNDEYVYKLLLAGTRNQKRCYHMIGDISVDAKGHGEALLEINPSDIDGFGTCLDSFSTVIVAAMSTKNASESLHPVLKGTLAPECIKSCCETPSAAEDFKGGNETPSTADDQYCRFYETVLLEKSIAIAKKQWAYQDIVPFSSNPKGIIWKKITDTVNFPMISPGSEAPIKKFSHFIWGYNDSHYFVGVPGRNLPQEQPDMGKSGFHIWLPIASMEELYYDKSLPVEERRQNVYGYWLSAINRYSGHIEQFPLIGS